jgi:hypothetical protein
MFLMLVLAKSLQDLVAAGYLQGAGMRSVFLLLVPVAFGVFIGRRSPLIGGVMNAGLEVTTYAVWFVALSYLDPNGLELVIGLLLLLCAVYVLTNVMRSTVTWGLAFLVLSGVALATCVPQTP